VRPEIQRSAVPDGDLLIPQNGRGVKKSSLTTTEAARRRCRRGRRARRARGAGV